MERIWAPWRIEYILKEKHDGCVLCDKPKDDNDVQNYILYRGDNNFIILNSYPYNPGHLLVAPYKHTGNLEDLTEEVRNEHFRLVSRCVIILKETFKPGGLNMGANMGKVAGAGIDDHFHSHIVPRWQGDTNFIPVLTDVRVIPQALSETYQALVGKF
ncbi:HIT domain-containing protein [Chloroflexota bacterium]